MHNLLLPASLIWLLLSRSASAQTALPSNATLPANNGSSTLPQLQLSISQGGMTSVYNMAPANDPEVPISTANVTYFQQTKLSGNIVVTNTSNFNSLAPKDLAYISCDPGDYSGGNIGIQEVLDTAAGKVTTNGSQGAIILYSLTSSWCNLTDAASLSTQNVFTFTEARWAQDLEDRLSHIGVPVAVANVMVNQTAPNNSTGNGTDSSDPTGPSPTTTVAMIILYSITGLITVCFLFIIITGAVRAHRHPERYRPRFVPGQSGPQRRARGIARAMLDSLPIVKFGEWDANKPNTEENGVELESGIERTSGVTTEQQQPPQPQQQGGEHVERVEHSEETSASPPSTDEIRAIPETTPHNHTEKESTAKDKPAEQPAEDQAEAGLACSVCTDDFVKGQDTRVLPCKHKFHPECIDPWLLNVSGTCPLCRTDLRPPAEATTSPAATEDSTSTPTTSSAPPVRATTALAAAQGVPIYVATGTNNVYRRDRRSGLGLGGYLHRALNARHMRDATPQQRMEALRDLRDSSRRDGEGGAASGSGSGSGDEAGESAAAATADDRARNRVSQKLRGLLGRGGGGQQSRPASGLGPVADGDLEAQRESAEVGGEVQHQHRHQHPHQHPHSHHHEHEQRDASRGQSQSETPLDAPQADAPVPVAERAEPSAAAAPAAATAEQNVAESTNAENGDPTTAELEQKSQGEADHSPETK